MVRKYRYDFMNDMAFGGGSELLAAGNDRGNVWSIIEEAMSCVLPLDLRQC